MIMQAIKNGVSEQAIAAALNVDVAKIRVPPVSVHEAFF
jgi:hypothetical protein